MHELLTEGEIMVKQMEDQPLFEYKHKRKLKVKILVYSKAVVVAHDTALDL